MIILLVVAALAAGAPLVAAVVVTVASHREESAHSLTGHPPRQWRPAARRLVCPASPRSLLRRPVRKPARHLVSAETSARQNV
jgi:hypothetical protein